MKVVVNGKQIELLESDYKAEGGEARIYVKKGQAFKIYHKPSKMIAPAKIRELAQLNRPNILAPKHIVQNTKGEDIGFAMPAVDNIEYLCKLFSKGFRKRESITPEMVAEVVKTMQETLSYIHSQNFLVVDYNAMNFLIDKKGFQTPYYIDVDSYQTPSFPATALMTTYRDRQVKNNKFTPLSDWFSWGLVSFQLYIGVHPYGGRHDVYKTEGFIDEMLDHNISVFDKSVKLPPACQDLSVIPKAHLEWYKRVFINGERSIPPLPGAIIQVAMVPAKMIAGNESFVVTQLTNFPSEIQGIVVSSGSRFYLTDNAVYREQQEVLKFTSHNKQRGIVPVAGDLFAIAEYNKQSETVLFCDAKKNKIGEIAGKDFTILNGCVYTMIGSSLVENSFANFGRSVVHQTNVVGQVFEPTAKLYKGVVLQDMLGKCHAVIPFAKGSATSIAVPELNGHRIIDAKFERGFLIVITERDGKFERLVFIFDKLCATYSVRSTVIANIDEVTFTVLDNGLCILVVEDQMIEAFFDNAKVKTVKKPPFNSEDTLYSEGNAFMVIKDERLYKVTLK